MQTENESYPELPNADDDRWQQAAIRVNGMPYIELLDLPDGISGMPLHQCYTGDMIAVIKRVRCGTWIAAKVGYKVGWLDVTHVNFTLTKVLETAEAQQIQSHRDWLDYVTDVVPRELLTSQVEVSGGAVGTSRENVSTNDLSRLVRYLKNLAFGKR